MDGGGEMVRGGRLRQLAALVRLELRRRLSGRRALALCAFALLPVLPVLIRAVHVPARHGGGVAHATIMYAVLYQALILRVVLFLGTVATFVSLFRGDELERVLHLYFLAPVRRELVMLAKYAAGVLLCGLPFTGTVVVSFVAAYAPHGLAQVAGRWSELGAYLACTWLAVAGYGALALLVGILFRNAMMPVLVLWGWEFANPVLPELLKKLSIVFWVQSLAPVQPPAGPLAVIAESAPAPTAVLCVLALSTTMVGLAAWRARGHEIRYAVE